MASGDKRQCSRLQPTFEVEAPSLISTAAPAESLKGPALAGSSEVGPSEMSPSGIIIFFI